MQILLSSLSLNVFLLFSHTQLISNVCHHASWCRKFRHLLHRCIAPWQKLPFLVYNQSTITIHSSYVMRPHQNYHILLARTNYHCFLVLYFCTNLPDWVSSFSNFYYEHIHILFINFSETTLYVIRFLHHIQASYVLTRHTDFSQNKTVIYSSKLTPYFISQPHIHFCRFP